jgi:hypothetical protein
LLARVGCDRLADELLGVAVFVRRSGVDEIQPGVEGAPRGGDEGVERDSTIGEIANTERGDGEVGAAERTARRDDFWRHAKIV